ncbi:transcriptional regulator [uncultured Methanobrevibacter sp.]|uniref:transcriptional regulator n=1 Tax=uncultured Methanobrevibacter sp. TaxID=253161 RepID=UPI0025FC0986|nr:transcriptional regulator [uncultured Methanobrevibacter sp.]
MITIDDDTLKIWSYINISSYRVKTVKALKDDVKTPTNIAADAGIRTTHISKVLKELKETGVAECINEDFRKGRLYKLTSLGEEIVEHLE